MTIPMRTKTTLLFASNLLLAATLAQAQCGYGTSEQDCYHQQRDAEHARQMDEMARQQQDQMQEQQVQDSDSQRSIQVRYADAWVAVVWHQDATEVWATWNQRQEQTAVDSALSACTAVMGEGCTLGISGVNSSIAIARSNEGFLSLGWGAKPSMAQQEAKKNCEKVAPDLRCKIEQTFTASPFPDASGLVDFSERQFPNQSVRRHRYVMIAMPKTQPKAAWLNKVWLSAGPGFELSKARVLERCQADSGIECEVRQSTANNGALIQYKDASQLEYWQAGRSKDAVVQRMRDDCKSAGNTCELIALYDTAAVRFEVVNSNGERQVTRPYFAIAWPKNNPKWNKLTIAARHPQLDAAKSAAIATCEQESGSPCQLLGEVDDGVYPMVALYRDSKNGVRWYLHNTKRHIEKMVDEDCKKPLTCKRLAIFDARTMQSSNLNWR
jgi:hypothetical protein